MKAKTNKRGDMVITCSQCKKTKWCDILASAKGPYSDTICRTCQRKGRSV